MLKKIISLFLTAFILVGCCACGEAIVDNPHDTQATQDTLNKKPISTNNNNSDNSNSDNNNSNNSTNNNESDENKPSNNRINIGGDMPYKIIYENGYSSEASILLEYLKDIDKNSSYTMSSDTTLDDGSCEILIGLTNRTASMNAKSKLSSYLDFSILIDKNKIAIYANTAERIEAAIDYFVNSIALDSESQLAYTTVTSYVEAYTDYAYPNLSVANAPINKFSIILPYNATKDEKSVAIKLSNWIAENCGYMPSILLDKAAPANNEIIIGNADRTESSSSDTENSNNVSYSATIKDGKVILYADTVENYDLAIKAFTDKIKASNGLLTKLNVKVLKQQEDNGENEEPTEPSLPDVPQNPTPDTTPKKAIFIGNSFIYWGGCVTYISNDSSNEAKREVGGDKGYFNEICKANGLNVDVYNYTYGGQNLDWIYENKLKSKSDSFLNSFDYVFISEAGQNQSSFKNTVKKVASLFKNAKEIVYLAHEYTFSQNATHIIGALDDLANDGFKIVAWGSLVNDVYNGKVKVPNATLKYNKNTFIKNASSSEKMNANAAVISISGYGDNFHQNPLSGYITAQMCFSAISGKSAVGQRYDFCWDSSIAPQYDLQNFLTYQYGKNQTSNFIDVFNSKTDMLGLQTLMDQYMDKYNKS